MFLWTTAVTARFQLFPICHLRPRSGQQLKNRSFYFRHGPDDIEHHLTTLFSACEELKLQISGPMEGKAV